MKENKLEKMGMIEEAGKSKMIQNVRILRYTLHFEDSRCQRSKKPGGSSAGRKFEINVQLSINQLYLYQYINIISKIDSYNLNISCGIK